VLTFAKLFDNELVVPRENEIVNSLRILGGGAENEAAGFGIVRRPNVTGKIPAIGVFKSFLRILEYIGFESCGR